MEQIDGVDDVRAPLELSKVFVSLQTAVSYACYAVVIVLAVVSIVVINNTIKITVFNRRKEIGIMKLVGATNGFIRFPFFVEGVTSGLIAALIASGAVCGAYYGLCRWYAENPSNLSQMLGGQLVPLQDVWYDRGRLRAAGLCAVRHRHGHQYPQTSECVKGKARV